MLRTLAGRVLRAQLIWLIALALALAGLFALERTGSSASGGGGASFRPLTSSDRAHSSDASHASFEKSKKSCRRQGEKESDAHSKGHDEDPTGPPCQLSEG